MVKATYNTNFETTTPKPVYNITDLSTVPDAVIAFTRDTTLLAWQNLQRMLAEVADTDEYTRLERKAETLFNWWLMLGGV